MFNPLKMGTVEKRLLIGGLANSIAYYGNLYAMTMANYPAQLKDRLEPHMPRNGEIIGSVAPPAVLYVAKKIVKNTGTKEKLGDMFLGATLFGIPNLTRDIVAQSAYQVGVDSRPSAAATAPLNMSRYIVQQTARPMASPNGVSKYQVTA